MVTSQFPTGVNNLTRILSYEIDYNRIMDTKVLSSHIPGSLMIHTGAKSKKSKGSRMDGGATESRRISMQADRNAQ
jgi:hypothetical protein